MGLPTSMATHALRKGPHALPSVSTSIFTTAPRRPMARAPRFSFIHPRGSSRILAHISIRSNLISDGFSLSSYYSICMAGPTPGVTSGCNPLWSSSTGHSSLWTGRSNSQLAFFRVCFPKPLIIAQFCCKPMRPSDLDRDSISRSSGHSLMDTWRQLLAGGAARMNSMILSGDWTTFSVVQPGSCRVGLPRRSVI